MEVLVGGFEGAGHDGFVGLVEVDEGHAHASPSSLDGREDVGLVGDEGGLLIEGELEDSAAFFLVGERGKDLVVEAEVGVVHVGAFNGSGELEGEAAVERYAGAQGHRGSVLFAMERYPSPLLPACKSFPFIGLRVVNVRKIFQRKEFRPKYCK